LFVTSCSTSVTAHAGTVFWVLPPEMFFGMLSTMLLTKRVCSFSFPLFEAHPAVEHGLDLSGEHDALTLNE